MRNSIIVIIVVSFSTVPTPSVTVTEPSDQINGGDSLILQCKAKISDSHAATVDTPFNYTWKNSGEVVSSAIAGDSNTLNIMSVTTSTGGNYSCEVFVTPKEFVSSNGTGMATVEVVVQGRIKIFCIHMHAHHTQSVSFTSHVMFVYPSSPHS